MSAPLLPRAVLAHPLIEAGLLPVSPLALAGLAVCLVVIVGRLLPARAHRRGAFGPPVPSYARSLSAADVVLRSIAVAALGLAVVAGRVGVDVPARNIAAVGLVGVGWPLLLVAAVALGPVWSRLDPFDGLARALGGGPPPPQPQPGPSGSRVGVWPALLPAVALGWYLTVYPATLQPRSIGVALMSYTVVTVAGALLVGRAAWLGRVEVVGLLLSWLGGLRYGGLARWRPPAGAPAVLGALAGGMWFGLLRESALWTPVLFRVGVAWAELAGFGLAALAGGGGVAAATRLARRRGDAGAVCAGLVPVVGALALASSLVDARLLVALARLPDVLVDPLGLGWARGAGAGTGLAVLPVDATTARLIQIGVLVAGGVLGAAVVRGRRGATPSAAPGIALGTVSGVLAVAIAAASAV